MKGVCDVNHNSLKFSTRILFSVHNHATSSHGFVVLIGSKISQHKKEKCGSNCVFVSLI